MVLLLRLAAANPIAGTFLAQSTARQPCTLRAQALQIGAKNRVNMRRPVGCANNVAPGICLRYIDCNCAATDRQQERWLTSSGDRPPARQVLTTCAFTSRTHSSKRQGHEYGQDSWANNVAVLLHTRCCVHVKLFYIYFNVTILNTVLRQNIWYFHNHVILILRSQFCSQN